MLAEAARGRVNFLTDVNQRRIEALAKAGDELRGQCDFRHEHECLVAALENLAKVVADQIVTKVSLELRNPGAADAQQGRLFIGFAGAELLGLLSFVIAALLIFA